MKQKVKMKNEILFLVIKYLGIIVDKELAVEKQNYESAGNFRNIEKSMIKEIEVLLNTLIEEVNDLDPIDISTRLDKSNEILSNEILSRSLKYRETIGEFDKKTLNISNYISKILGYSVESAIRDHGVEIILRDLKLKLICE